VMQLWICRLILRSAISACSAVNFLTQKEELTTEIAENTEAVQLEICRLIFRSAISVRSVVNCFAGKKKELTAQIAEPQR
jgi:hypothetical protein